MIRKEVPPGMEICPVCDGKGEAYFSCCTGQPVNEDIPICPCCKEHLGEDTCEGCDGTGLVPENTVEPVVKFDWILMAESRENR